MAHSEVILCLSSCCCCCCCFFFLLLLSSLLCGVKTNREDVPVVLVGGGCVLVDEKVPLKGSSCLKIPEDHWVS